MPYDNSKHEAEEATYDGGFVSNTELYKHLVNGLAKAQYRLTKHPTGLFCGHHVYKLKQIPIAGIKCGSYYWQQLKNSEQEVAAFQEIVSIQEPPEGLDKEAFKSWRKLLNSFAFPSDGTTIAYKLSRSCLLYADDLRFKMSLLGKSNCDVHKIAPQVGWFSEELQTLDARDLLSLFPDAEASTFMLVLGRALAGASGEATREGTLQHTFRSMAIVIGKEAGLGKTTLLTNIVSVMEKCGYVTDVLKTRGRFGWASPVLADLAYNDDLNKRTQKQLLTEDKIKTIVTGGKITTEEKGVKDVSLTSRAALISCSNHYNKMDYLDMDGGEISRSNLLYTHSGRELDRLWQDRYPCSSRPATLWAHLEEKYAVTSEILTAYLLARSLEMFLDCIGYSVATGQTVRVAADRTQELIERNRSQYRYDTDMANLSDLVETVASAVALSLASKPTRSANKIIKRMQSRAVVFSPDLLRATVDFALEPVNHDNLRTWGLDGIIPDVLSPQCYKTYKNSKHMLERPGMTLAEVFDSVVGHLIANDGIQFPKKMAIYTPIFTDMIQQIDSRVDDYRAKMDLHEVDFEDDTFENESIRRYLKTVDNLL